MAFQLFNVDIGGGDIGQGIEKLGAGIATGEEKDKMVSSRAKQYEKLVQTMNESFGDKSPFKDVDLHGMNRYDMASAFADSHTMIDSFSKFQEQQTQAQYRQSEIAKMQAITENMRLMNEATKKLLAGGETKEPKFNTPAAAALYEKNKQVVQAKEDAKNLGIDPTPFLRAAETLQNYHTKVGKYQQDQQQSQSNWENSPMGFLGQVGGTVGSASVKALAGLSGAQLAGKAIYGGNTDIGQEASDLFKQQQSQFPEAGKDVDDATRLLAGLNNNPELKAVVAPIIHDHFNSNPVTASSFTQSSQPQIKRIGQVVVDNKKK